MPLNHIFRKGTGRYKHHESQKKKKKLNHVIYVDDIRLFAKNEKESKTLILAVRIYIQDIGMEFGIENCTMLIMRSGKYQMTEGIELPNSENQNARRKGKLQILGNIGSGYCQTKQDERKNWKIVSLENEKKLLRTKLYSRNFIKGINTKAVPNPCKILGTILKVDEGRALTNGPENKKTHDDT